MKYLPFYFLFAAAIILQSCGGGTSVSVDEFSPLGEVENLTTFTVEFSENLAPVDSQNVWLEDEFIKFDPPIQGKFKWISPSELIFSPDQPLDPIQQYTAEITDKVLFGKDLTTDFESYTFHTPFFDVVSVEFFWNNLENEYYTLIVQANITFNYEVSPAELKEYLQVEADGDEITDFTIQNTKPSNVIAINFGKVKQSEKLQEFEVTVREGLESILGKEPLAESRTFEESLPPITQLAITGVASGYEDGIGWIEVSTTQKIDEKELQKYVKVTPADNLKFSTSANSFRIEGNFDAARTVELNIKKDLPGLYGGKLADDYVQVVPLAELDPAINFTDKSGKYLMLGAENSVQVSAVNVDAVDIEISKVYKNNILFFLDRNSYAYYDYGYDYGYNPNYYVGNTGKLIYESTVDLSSQRNWLEKFAVSFDSVLNTQYKGIYVAKVMSSEDRWINDSKVVAISDLGIMAKKSDDELLVFINSISDAIAVEGAEVSLLSSNNQVLLSAVTGVEGIVKFDGIADLVEGFSPRLITVEKGEDFNFIDLRETLIETSRFDVGAGAREFSAGYRVFMYSERDLYRPGETMNISAIVRNDYIQVVSEIPVVLKIIAPNGKTFDEFQPSLNEQGSFEQDFSIPDYAMTGQYTAELYTGGKKLIGAYSFSVEEFVPDKIRVTLNSDKEKAGMNEAVNIDIDAEFLFGAKAAGLKYEADVQLRHIPFTSKEFASYDFSNSSVNDGSYDNVFFDGSLDDNGSASFRYFTPQYIESGGIVRGYAFVSVFDLTGRTVNRVATFDIYPKDYFIGIKSPGYYAGVNDDISFNIVALDKTEKPFSNFKAEATLVRYEWQTVLKKDYSGNFYYASEQKEEIEWTKPVTLSGKSNDLEFSVDKSGKYELRISKQGSSQYQRSYFYAYGWHSATASSFEVDKEGRIEIVFDKEKYSPGETADILFMGPFDGKMLVTFERNGVMDYRYVEFENRSAELSYTVSDNFLPNVYVTATLFRSHTISETSPFLVGHGFASMKVEDEDNKLPVTITAPEKIKPRTTQRITIETDARKDIFVTLAAVDEGILQIKNYVTPDPYAYMYAKRSLRTESYDLYKYLLPNMVTLQPSVGGDGYDDEPLRKRTNPITTKRFKLLSYWSGIKKTDSDGKVTVDLQIPQFNGEVRLMAVVYTRERFGSGEKYMKVADDLIIEPEMPRFLSAGDTLTAPVTLINTTDSRGDVTVKVKVEGPLGLLSEETKKVNVPANSTGRALFKISAGPDVGAGKITFETSGIAKVKEEINIGVRPVSPFVVETGSGLIEGGKTVKVDVPVDYLEATQHTVLTISKFPAIQFADQLKKLVGYPYGCIEQTVSKAFPQIYLEELVKLAAPELYRTQNPTYFVKEAVRKVESMQLYNGAMAYWQGSATESWWGSVYAAHFLIESKKAGYSVNEDVLKKLLKYIENRAKSRETYDYVTYTQTSRRVQKIARKEIPYSLYVLALANKGDLAAMNYYKARPHLLSTDMKYLLAGSYALMGKWNAYYELMPKTFEPVKPERQSGGTFDSELRANSIMLNVLLEVQPQSEQIPVIVKYLANNSKNLYNTQERSFFFLAMGKAADNTSYQNVKVDVMVDGKKIKTFDGTDFTIDEKKLNRSNIELVAKGSGEVYYFWSTEGVKSSGNVKEEDNYLQVRREFFDYRTGRKIIDNTFTQGQLVVCKITLMGSEMSVENVAVSDLVPSGFEIENPRLTSNDRMTWNLTYPMNPEHVDIRDDRILLFTDVGSNDVNEYQYLMRVVNQGTFKLPVIGAEAMYAPDFHSYYGAGTVKVLPG